MKHIITLLIIFNSIILAQTIMVEGKVVDLESNDALAGVNITISNSNAGTATLLNGTFSLEGNFSSGDILTFTYIGYNSYESSISDYLESGKVVRLQKGNIRLSKTVVVEGLIAKEGITPASFSKISRKEIEENYTVQDIPEYLSYLPSTTFYSDNGNGIGYNYVSIRGFGQRRISIAYNGIPQNDPEDHNSYWHNISDLLESTELVQVQRGAGAGIIGYPSIGGSINIITSPFSDKPNFDFSSSIGSYNTRKYSAKFSSGLIDNKYSVYAKLSKTLSDGYRDNSWIDFNSYHLSAARYDENLTTILNFYGGPVSDGLAYYGLPKSFIKNKDLRKTNFLSSDEIENFSQPHYELLNELKINNNLTFNSALFFVTGDGFFDFDGSWSIYYDDYFRLKEAGYSEDQTPTNALIRAQVENKQWGWLPKLTWEHNDGTLILGAEYRNHRSVHWGSIRYAENIPADVPQDHKYYKYKGGNDIFNFFANENYNINEKLNILGEIQVSYHNYKLFEEKYLGNDISINGLYINPRLGFNYKFNNAINTYVSYARVTRAPRLKNYYDAAESSGGSTPQFEENTDGSYNFDKPLVNPEVMNDIEMGARYQNNLLTFNANIFYMLFNDEIVSKGQLDRFGQPITGNIDKTIHAGIEVDGKINIHDNINFIFNASYSKNYVSDGITFINSSDIEGNSIIKELDLADNSIAGFPELTMNAILKANYNGLAGQLSAKFVGDYFSDNYDENLSQLLSENIDFVDYSDNKVDSYLVMNFMGSYEFELNEFFKRVRVFAQVNNIFDNLYAAYATGGDFFPAAERNILVGMKLGL
jgi:iron complex outermembrane recepter protein